MPVVGSVGGADDKVGIGNTRTVDNRQDVEQRRQNAVNLDQKMRVPEKTNRGNNTDVNA